MPDETSKSKNTEETKQPASSIFLEMMRQRAADALPMDKAEDTAKEADPAKLVTDFPDDEVDLRKEELRLRRVRRRKQRRQQRHTGLVVGIFRTWFVVGTVAILTATIFTWWQGPEFLSAEVRDDLSIALATATQQGVVVQATAIPVTPNWLRRVGVVSGHRGPENDPGAVCADGLTEAEVNLEIAQRVVSNLQARGYTVDLLDEFDPRLAGYAADALISIHANSCQEYGDFTSGGYLISTADARTGSGNDQLLVECVASYYGDVTQLTRRTGLTRDMTDYHIFREISPSTPGAIIEVGFLSYDRELLTQRPDMLANGITTGVMCFLEPENPNILATLQAPDSAR